MLKAPQIRFCRASDGVRIAYATTGSGPAMIEVATWLNHLEFDWQSPVWRPRLVEMAKNYTMARYDGRGCGLSDRTVEDLSFDANLRDLEAVADAAGFKRFILLGSCQGSGLAIAYAARHPERVSNLVLYGAFARGRLKRNPSARDLEEANVMLKLVELGWGRENPAFRQVYTTMFIPESTPEQFRWFTDLQRMSTSPENAVGLIQGFDAMDVTDLLPKISCPTLVLHARNDARVPFGEGRMVASSIAGAEFVPLESRNHILLEHQPAWKQFLAEIARFVHGQGRTEASEGTAFAELTQREREVLELIARGLDNAAIASQLSVSPKTVRNHINGIFDKLNIPNRAQAIVRAREAGMGTRTG
ncbi:MAG: alpha/beta fold hydrolase [Bradyrhizobium sp.]|uniref:alpha/beta fold hydrolase n=1 Tax=Bradyrhizobium sp. TaxID=376 RepID=UPI0011F5537E|nr:alpha/beta fold hydrolase [Bradyrhizobium sp.]THD46195.1 MAG: alpha/beta fold hydrolase [Bradyrhizobium sp.]